MPALPIRTYPDTALRKKCRPVEPIDERTRKLAADMLETLHDAPGVGLAAPQVGKHVRLVVVDLSVGEDPDQVHILVNPVIENPQGEQNEEEGCLSLPEVTERVRRFETVRVRALNAEGREIILDARGVLSRVLQHEIDHLDGKLLFDRLNKVKREAVKRRLKKNARASAAS